MQPVDKARILPRAFPLSWVRLRRIWSCIGWGFLVTLGFFGLRAGAALIDGHLFSSSKVIGFFADPSVYTNFVFGWLLFTFYLWLPHGIAAMMAGLQDNEILLDPLSTRTAPPPSQDDHDDGLEIDWVDIVLDRFDRRRLFIGGLIAFVAVGGAMGFIYRAMAPGIWYTAGTVSMVTAQIWAGVLVFCIISVLLACWAVVLSLKEIFRGGTNVRPLHPDGVGGLAPLANFALGLVYLISIVGIMLLAVTPYTRSLAAGSDLVYTVTTDIVIAAIIYAVASPLVFFQVLATASNAMRDAKNELLGRIATRWDSEYPESVRVLETVGDDPTPAVERLKAIRELYQTTKEFPVWPFDQANVRKFIGSYLAPLFTGFVIEFLINLLRP